MTTKKSSTKRPAKGKASEASLENLALLIAGVLSHPDTPQEIYDHLIYGINECVSSSAINHHPGYITAILTEYAAKEGGAK